MRQKKADVADSELVKWLIYIALIIVAIVIIRYFTNDIKLIASKLI